MNILMIEKTRSTPFIEFNPETHTHKIIGESYPENTNTFYKPVLSFLGEYLNLTIESPIVFEVELIYFNSSSSKLLMDIFDMLDDACKQGKKITVKWLYDEADEALQEYGEEFAEDSECLDFQIVSK